MKTIKITLSQLFILIVLFEMGSAILVGLGVNAKQDAWISILLGLLGGIMLFQIYYKLYKYYPDLPLTSYAQNIMGKWAGRGIGFLYIIYFIYGASRVLRDFGELLTTTIYFSTPLFIVNSLMILTIIYTIHKGFEVLARVGELYFALVYFMAIGGILLVGFSGIIHFEALRPVLENGWMPVLKTFAGETINFPFGEMVVFTMLLPFIKESKNVKLTCLSAMMLSGINIIITTVINIAALGVDLFVRSPFPLLTTVSKIQIANFIERLDVLFMIYLVISGFFKITIYFYAAAVGAATLFGFQDPRQLSFPIGMLILFSSMSIASNYAEHIKEGLQVVPVYLHWPFQIVIPILLLITAFIKNKMKNNKTKSGEKTKKDKAQELS